MNAKELILQVTDNQVGKPVKAGHNGPYIDPETKIRNLGHWVILMAKAYEWTENIKYKNELIAYADQMLSEEFRPFNASFHHRDKDGKDQCNGLVGQAWSIEALAEATAVTNDSKYKDLALNVYHKHTFNEHFNLWHILEIDGRKIELDPTFNHQLWFASAVSYFYHEDKRARRELDLFFDSIDDNLTVMHNGLIFHPIDRNLQHESSGLKEQISNVLKALKFHPAQLKRRFSPDEFTQKLIYKSIGYHDFNLYAFEVIRKNVPELSFWKSNSYLKIMRYGTDRALYDAVEDNMFAYPYNAPGFEFPFVFSRQANNEELLALATDYLKKQISLTYDRNSYIFEHNNEDPATLTARLYELARTDSNYLEMISI